MNGLLLNNKNFVINTGNLPLIIHGQEGNGASQFSLHIMASFYQLGAKFYVLQGFLQPEIRFMNLLALQATP